MPGEINIYTCACETAPGTTPPALAPYVVSIQSLQGIITLNGTGVLDISTSGNTINFGLAGGAGLGTVTSVAASSSNSNLVIAGSPIETFGTLAFSLAGALNSISGLVTAADKMIYTTASDTYAVTDLTSFARTILDDASATAVRTTLGLVIGTNVQAWSADLDSFVTNVTWTGADPTFVGNLEADSLTSILDLTVGNNATIGGTLGIGGTLTVTGVISGPGSGLTALNASNLSSGTTAVARGGTGLASYTTGQVLYASAATTIAGLTAGAAGTFLRFAGAGVAPVVSTLILPNAGTTGDVFIATATNTMGRVTGVATGNVFLSGGVGVIPAWGKVTTSHTTGIAASGSNSDITALSALSTVTATQVDFTGSVGLASELFDSTAAAGGSGYLLSSLGGGGVLWTNQITIDTLTLNTNLSIEGTITAGGTTGAQTINKPSGTVNFAAAAASLVVTNSLCTTAHRVLATVVTNDTTMKSVSCVTTNGAFTLTANAAATAETAVYWVLIQVS